jgi:hypothetical protein
LLSDVSGLSYVRRVRSPAFVQHVDAPEAWALENLWLLAAVFDAFKSEGVWPRIEDVQRTLAKTVPAHAVAVGQLVIDIPAELGHRDQERIRLTVRALAQVQGAEPLLAHFVAAMRLAYDTYLGDGASVLHGADVKTTLAVDDMTFRKVSELVFSEPWFFSGGSGGSGDNWDRAIRAEVVLMDGVTDVAGYLDAVARYRFGEPDLAVDQAQAVAQQALSPARRQWLGRWLRKQSASVGDLIVIGIIAAVVAGVILWRVT